MVSNKSIVLLITLLSQTLTYCESLDDYDVVNVLSASPPPPEPNSVKAQSSTTPQVTVPVPTSAIFSSTTQETVPRKLPTVLQEASADIPLTRSRSRNDRINMRGRNANRNRNNPDKLLGRLFGFGSRFIARSLALMTGHDLGESREGRFRNYENFDIDEAVGSVRDTNASQEESQSLSDKLRNIDPAQLLLSRFLIKRDKMEHWRDIKDSYRKKELDRRIDFFTDDSGDIMSRNVKNVMRALVNRYEKDTNTLQVWVNYRAAKLKRFIEIPLVASILGNNNTADDINPTSAYTRYPASASSRKQNDEGESDEDVSNARVRTFNPIADISRKFMRFFQNIS